MSVDRWYLPRIRLTSILAVFMVVAVSAQADDTWHNIYHHLRRFFTGKSSSTPVVHHRRRHTEDEDDEKSTVSTEPSPSPGENAVSPGASATPRVVILPSGSPTAEGTPGVETPAPTLEPAAKPEPSPEAPKAASTPELGPVLRSLSAPTPMSSPGVISSPAPGAGRTVTN
jgi:hypothetical protein